MEPSQRFCTNGVPIRNVRVERIFLKKHIRHVRHTAHVPIADRSVHSSSSAAGSVRRQRKVRTVAAPRLGQTRAHRRNQRRLARRRAYRSHLQLHRARNKQKQDQAHPTLQPSDRRRLSSFAGSSLPPILIRPSTTTTTTSPHGTATIPGCHLVASSDCPRAATSGRLLLPITCVG